MADKYEPPLHQFSFKLSIIPSSVGHVAIMELRLVPIFGFLLLASAVSHAALTSEEYWDSVLPNTPMPKAVRDFLPQHDLEEEKNTQVTVGKGGVAVNTGKPGGKGTSVNVGHKGGVAVNTGKPGGKGTSVNVGHKGGVNVRTGKGGGTNVNVGGRKGGGGGGRTKVNVGKGGVDVHTGHKGKPVIVAVHPGSNPFDYNYAASEDQLHADPNVALFFLEKDLHAGTKMNLHFTTSTARATLLPQKLANAIPFSSENLPVVMNQFSIEPQSAEAEAMRQTVQQCEEPAQEGEEKTCATSLESMLDFTTSKLGKDAHPISTEVDKEQTPEQQYTIAQGVRQVGGGESSVVCHSQTYAYAVFYCHETHSTKAYKVPLVGADGTKASAVAVCHTDTSKWNPKHLAFQVLKVKPGTVPVCHFLPEDHIVWTST